VEVKDGRCIAGSTLAGSVLTMDRAVRNVMQFSRWSLREAVQAATLNPALAVGLAGKHGVLARDADADLAVLSPAGEVLRALVRGQGS
jgi:N-acetylglucosamine-6-phosphate deacetylase